MPAPTTITSHGPPGTRAWRPWNTWSGAAMELLDGACRVGIVGRRAPGRDHAILDVGKDVLQRPAARGSPTAGAGRDDADPVAGRECEAPHLRRQRALRGTRIQDDRAAAAG